MDLIEAIVLGAVQGITEFLPISSTAHLILVPWFLGWPPGGLAFDVSLHLGTLVALLVYFRKDWWQLLGAAARMLKGERNSPDARMVQYLVIATIPGGVAGLLLEDFVDQVLRSPLVIAFTLILLALVLVVAERVGRRQKDMDAITWADAITVGVAQALALVPGVSRSGVTMTAGLFRGMTRDAAARFSFFLSTPLIGGAVAKKLLDVAEMGLTADQFRPFAVGILASGLVGYAAIGFLLRYLRTRNTMVFVYYRIALGLVILLAYQYGFRQ